MSKRDGYPTGVPCWVDTSQPDPAAATEFYGGLFGWEFENVSPAGAPPYFMARLDGGDVAGIGGQEGDAPPAWNTYVWVERADDTAAAVNEAGGTVAVEPFDVGDFGRTAVFVDPAGAFFRVWQANGHRGAQTVNEDGAWSWSNVFTTDADKVAAFYGQVFGWTAAPMGEQPPEMGVMLCRPGYVDHLAELNPEFPKLLVEWDAPAGFGDLIALLAPLEGSMLPPGTRPHWGVTFGVADTDDLAAKAERLGAKILVPPFTGGPVRDCVLADPAGAVFTISHFTPPTEAA